jgi:hypothetical protein
MSVSIMLILSLFVVSTGAITGAKQASGTLPPGASGVTAAVLAAMEPVATDGYELQVFRSVWLPGSSVSTHTNSGALVSCVESGVLTIEIQEGAATVTRAQPIRNVPVEIARAHPYEGAEAITLGTPISYGPGDCVAFDEDAAHTIHTAWNEGAEPVVLWETHLSIAGEPVTTFVNDQGTPAS